ncbi:MAG: tripartite tricarboxylate transporter substrate binding protein [Oscillibacter sp.]|nr:tripartite tricarboxylate transporter substrate binding protein [Oscillibacter sp.]
MKKLLALGTALVLALSLAACNGGGSGGEEVSADWKPGETVTMIVAYKAGSGTDNTARVLSQYASEKIGQTIVIDNQEGGSGSIGWTALAKSNPDGYTLGFVNLPTLASNIVEGLGDYSMEDFVPICNHVNETSLVLVSASSPFNSLQELVDYAKAHPDELKASTNGNKASNHIGAQLLANSAGFTYTAIPYGGTADQLLALRQGEVDFSVAKEADIVSMVSELKILGVFDTARMDAFPDAPTLGELGYYDQWYGSARAIVAPKGTPQAIIDFYEQAFREAMEDPAYLEAAEKAGITTAYMNAADTAQLLADQYLFCTETVASLWES